jgi:hypothetical protein
MFTIFDWIMSNVREPELKNAFSTVTYTFNEEVSKKYVEPRIHELKIEDCYLENLASGRKKVEIRFNDRDYQVGDILLFKKVKEIDRICHNKGKVKTTEYRFTVTHVHSGLGMQEGYVALSVERI